MATELEKQLAIKLLTERLERETGKKVVLKEAEKPAQEKLKDFLLKNPGATRKQILQDLYNISPEAARANYGASGAHTAENILSRALTSGLIRMDSSVSPVKWYASGIVPITPKKTFVPAFAPTPVDRALMKALKAVDVNPVYSDQIIAELGKLGYEIKNK